MNYLKKTYLQLTSSWNLRNVILILTAGFFFLASIPLNRYKSIDKTVPVPTGNEELRHAFQSTLDSMRVSFNLPGATAAYMLTDGTKGVAASGLADIESGTPMTPKTRMLAASIGKTFVGATAVSLADEGILNMDVPIKRWLGYRSWFQRLPNRNQITLRHLLTHRSGLPNHVYMDEFASTVSKKWRSQELTFPPDSLIQFVLDKPPLFEADKGWAYTDTGYILVGMIIEQATGRDYYEIIDERFLIPLGLKFTSPSNTRLLPGLASGYAAENAFGFPQKTTISEEKMVWHPGIEWTGGGLVSTSEDLARWGAALFSGSALQENALKLLLNSSPIDSSSPGIHYGMGVTIYQDTPYGPIYGHGGWIPGYTSSLRYYKDYGVAIAFQINTDIGILEDSSTVVESMESRLAEIILLSSKQE